MNDTQITRISGRGIPLPGDDIDTDRIIPARFMKCVTFDGLGQYAFHDARFEADGTEKRHPLNDPAYKNAEILIAGKNFGCGSSREHAPQALMRYGIRAVIGESFAEIFAGNCTVLGIPVVRAARGDVEALRKRVETDPVTEIRIDLASMRVDAGGLTFDIDMPDSARKSLTGGLWDTTTLLLAHAEQTRAMIGRLPYLRRFN
ncbi:MAG TPA: 3-isopropylmalate dehydratase small subunit [bacterium]|nr:3-isopropylmalate dehydratase small subunit [bacterium]